MKDETSKDPARAVLEAADKLLEAEDNGRPDDVLLAAADHSDAVLAWRAAGRPGVEIQICERCGDELRELMNVEPKAPSTPRAPLAVVRKRLVRELEAAKHLGWDNHVISTYENIIGLLDDTLSRARCVEGVWDGYNIMDPNGEHVLAIDRPKDIPPGTPVTVVIEEDPE